MNHEAIQMRCKFVLYNSLQNVVPLISATWLIGFTNNAVQLMFQAHFEETVSDFAPFGKTFNEFN